MEEQIYRQPRRSGKKWILIIAAVFVLLLSAVAFVLTANRLSLSVELDGEPEMMLEYGGHFQDPGAHLCVRGSLLWKDGHGPRRMFLSASRARSMMKKRGNISSPTRRITGECTPRRSASCVSWTRYARKSS